MKTSTDELFWGILSIIMALVALGVILVVVFTTPIIKSTSALPY